MSFYQFYKEQILHASIEEVWEFISSPINLKEITPKYMGFDITSDLMDDKMYPGMIISYKVSPVLGIKTTWVTEITQVRDKSYFVDEQRVGPYSIWHHQHIIEQLPNGVIMKDIISYQPPFGFLGAIANRLFIKSKLNEIFDYRRKVLDLRFNASKMKVKIAPTL
ncbi:SRPBCC family protein [Marinifilum sp. D714]|uniref:SRPBCC family protein n=1 Tax=Marinifilum sp. D714 TaxID=2937523 RepID=UPI0027BB68C1|nr:SRPBCC family protein [Marinifilum sp. D714]MDQ2178193.1 SRPBCC family protein [Marinifilum sp. D714]